MMLLATLVRFEICWFTLGYSVFAVLGGMSIEEKAKSCSLRVGVECRETLYGARRQGLSSIYS